MQMWKTRPGLCMQDMMMQRDDNAQDSFFASLFADVSRATLDSAGEAAAEGGEPGWSPVLARTL